jgi:hypothetical protein
MSCRGNSAEGNGRKAGHHACSLKLDEREPAVSGLTGPGALTFIRQPPLDAAFYPAGCIEYPRGPFPHPKEAGRFFRPRGFPRLGKNGMKISKAWKNFRECFQCLENRPVWFPILGNIISA